jgi:hypothetical protein
METESLLFIEALIVRRYRTSVRQIKCKRLCYSCKRFTISQISLNPLAVVFNCLSKAAWELLTAMLKLHGSYIRVF